MRNRHVTRFGDPTTRTGALYGVSDQRGLALMAMDLDLARLHMEGVPITPRDLVDLEAEVLRAQARHRTVVSQVGIPDSILNLLHASKKSEAVKLAKAVTLTEFQLFLLIHNSRQIGLKHRSRFPEYIPEHLVITDEDTSKLKQGEFRPVSKKLPSLLLERRHIHVHLFEQRGVWHCFYFSYDDIEPIGKNHWVHGPHLHYVGHLWPNHTKATVWRSFDRRKTEIAGNLHIRFLPFDFSDEAWPPQSLRQAKGRSIGSLIFAPELATHDGTGPTPAAQLATRGVWFTNVSVPQASENALHA